MDKIVCETKELFLEKLRDLVRREIPEKEISYIIPYPVHEIDEILETEPSKLSVISFGGGFVGAVFGFLLAVYTVYSWPIISGGKPMISTPAYVIIAFACTILFSALCSLAGFLFLSKLPDIRQIASPEDYDNKFVILVGQEELE